MQAPSRNRLEVLSHDVFNALMWSLSYPGEKQATKHANLVAIGQTLLDLETSFFTTDDALKKELIRTTSKAKNIIQADYLLFPSLSENDIEQLEQAKRGDLIHPDKSACIILTCKFDKGTFLKLTGPGIETETSVISSIPKAFWILRNKTQNYPLGWDVFLCDGQNIIGIPRSSKVTL